MRKLVKEEGFGGVGLEDGEEIEGMLSGMENLPVGELGSTSGRGDPEGEMITWKSSGSIPRSSGPGQIRGFSTIAHRPSTSSKCLERSTPILKFRQTG